jgi:spore maturation protein CgeB
MKILYVAMKYDYGLPEQGLSFEHNNFFHSLVSMGHDIIYFDFMSLLKVHGRRWINGRIAQIVESERPDLLFSCLFTREFDFDTFRSISRNSDTATVNWFTDDHWRFDAFSSKWAPCFNWAITTSNAALTKYREAGIPNVIKSQWGCNHFLYRPLDLPLIYDVTFVGQPHGNRREIIESLRAKGIEVNVWGTGWESGRVGQEEMIRVFSQSRINLNLSNASAFQEGKPSPLRRVVGNLLPKVPGGDRLKGLLKAADHGPRPEKATQVYPDQIKGRNFEVPGCGGFLLTGLAEDLEDCYMPGREIATFGDLDDLAEKIRHYLRHEEDRSRMGKAGYDRTMTEHTYVHRFSEIFTQIGLNVPSAAEVFQTGPTWGQLEEIR